MTWWRRLLGWRLYNKETDILCPNAYSYTDWPVGCRVDVKYVENNHIEITKHKRSYFRWDLTFPKKRPMSHAVREAEGAQPLDEEQCNDWIYTKEGKNHQVCTLPKDHKGPHKNRFSSWSNDKDPNDYPEYRSKDDENVLIDMCGNHSSGKELGYIGICTRKKGHIGYHSNQFSYWDTDGQPKLIHDTNLNF